MGRGGQCSGFFSAESETASPSGWARTRVWRGVGGCLNAYVVCGLWLRAGGAVQRRKRKPAPPSTPPPPYAHAPHLRPSHTQSAHRAPRPFPSQTPRRAAAHRGGARSARGGGGAHPPTPPPHPSRNPTPSQGNCTLQRPVRPLSPGAPRLACRKQAGRAAAPRASGARSGAAARSSARARPPSRTASICRPPPWPPSSAGSRSTPGRASAGSASPSTGRATGSRTPAPAQSTRP